MKKFKMMMSAPAAEEVVVPPPVKAPALFLDTSDARPPALTDAAVAAAEAALGVTLPQSLKDTLNQRNGGYLARCSHPAAPNSWSSNHVPVDFLPGIWSGGADVGELPELVTLQRLKEKRGIPKQMVILCGDDHGCIALDYGAGSHAEPAVVYWQKTGPALAVASDFASFKDGLCNMERMPDAPPVAVAVSGGVGGDGGGGGGADDEDDYEVESGWGVAALLGPDLLDDDEEDDASFHGGADEEDEDFVDEELDDGEADPGPDADELILPPGKKRDRAPLDPGDVKLRQVVHSQVLCSMIGSTRTAGLDDQSGVASLESSTSDASELQHGGLMQSLADERPDLVSRILRLLDPIDLVHVSICSKFLHRIVERDDAAWRAMMEKNMRLSTFLNLPRCFTEQQKITYALRQLHRLEKEATELRKVLDALQAAPPVSSVWDLLRRHIGATSEPLLDQVHNPIAKPVKARKGLMRANDADNESKLIDKRIAKDKSREPSADVVLLGMDPMLSFALCCQAAMQSPASDMPDDPVATRMLIVARIVRVSHTLAAECVGRWGGAKLAMAQRVLDALANESGFRNIVADLPVLWVHANDLLSQLCLDLRRNYGRIIELLAVQRLVCTDRWKDVQTPTYVPTPADALLTGSNITGVRTYTIPTRTFHLRIIDVTALLLKCKRSRVLRHVDGIEIVAVVLDVGQELPNRIVRDKSWALFEQMKLCEALCNSAAFRKTSVMILANTEGVGAMLGALGTTASPGGTVSDQGKPLRFLRERLRAVCRTPANLSVNNILLTHVGDPKLSDFVCTAMADLYLARNVQRGF